MAQSPEQKKNYQVVKAFKALNTKANRTAIADGYAAQAKEWRRKYGGSGGGMGSQTVTRQDGYSDDIDNVEE